MRYTSADLQTSGGGQTTSSGKNYNADPGVFFDINRGDITFEPGLIFVLKGGVNNFTSYATATTIANSFADLNLYCLDVPLNILYNFKVKPGKIFIGGGPYLGYTLSGKSKILTYGYTITPNGEQTFQNNTDQSATFGSGVDDLNRFDFGANLLAGFRLNKGWEINAGLGFGLANVCNVPGYTTHNHTTSFGLGYFFK